MTIESFCQSLKFNTLSSDDYLFLEDQLYSVAKSIFSFKHVLTNDLQSFFNDNFTYIDNLKLATENILNQSKTTASEEQFLATIKEHKSQFADYKLLPYILLAENCLGILPSFSSIIEKELAGAYVEEFALLSLLYAKHKQDSFYFAYLNYLLKKFETKLTRQDIKEYLKLLAVFTFNFYKDDFKSLYRKLQYLFYINQDEENHVLWIEEEDILAEAKNTEPALYKFVNKTHMKANQLDLFS